MRKPSSGINEMRQWKENKLSMVHPFPFNVYDECAKLFFLFNVHSILMVHPFPYCFLTYNGLYDAIQYECPTLHPYFFSFNCRISFIPDDRLHISRNVEQNNVFDYCGCFICNKNLQQLRAALKCDVLLRPTPYWFSETLILNSIGLMVISICFSCKTIRANICARSKTSFFAAVMNAITFIYCTSNR